MRGEGLGSHLLNGGSSGGVYRGEVVTRRLGSLLHRHRRRHPRHPNRSEAASCSQVTGLTTARGERERWPDPSKDLMCAQSVEADLGAVSAFVVVVEAAAVRLAQIYSRLDGQPDLPLPRVEVAERTFERVVVCARAVLREGLNDSYLREVEAADSRSNSTYSLDPTHLHP